MIEVEQLHAREKDAESLAASISDTIAHLDNAPSPFLVEAGNAARQSAAAFAQARSEQLAQRRADLAAVAESFEAISRRLIRLGKG